MKATIVPALFASMLLGGCASNTLSKDECRSGEQTGRLQAEVAPLEKDRVRYQQELDAYRTRVATR